MSSVLQWESLPGDSPLQVFLGGLENMFLLAGSVFYSWFQFVEEAAKKSKEETGKKDATVTLVVEAESAPNAPVGYKTLYSHLLIVVETAAKECTWA